MPWQEPDGGLVSRTGRTDLHATVDTTGRTSDRRSDFDDVYGDWDALRAPIAAPRRMPTDVAAALRKAPSRQLTDGQCAVAADRRGPDLEAVVRWPTTVRRDTVGDEVTYVVNRNVNFTNVCYTGCRFCAFAQRRTDADAYSLSLEEVGRRAAEAWEVGATEICMQGGIDPQLPGTAYLDLARAVKAAAPDIHLHAFSPMEVVNGAARMRLSIGEFLVAAREAGVDSLPGTAAEILDDDVRWVLTKGKLPTAQWIEVVTTAHRIGLPTTSTMMYGHVDEPRHWAGAPAAAEEAAAGERRLHRVRPAAVRAHQRADLPRRRSPGPGPTVRDNRAVHAVARLVLHGRDRPHPGQLGEARRRAVPRRCSPAASTTSAAR